MANPPSTALQFYLAVAWLSLPGTWWLAFEMYGLTFVYGGPGMVLYGVLHSWPFVGLLIVFSWWLLAVWFLLTIAAIFLSGYRQWLGVGRSILVRVALVICVQFALMLSYEFWSARASLRVVACLVGVATMLVLTVWAFGPLRRRHHSYRA